MAEIKDETLFKEFVGHLFPRRVWGPNLRLSYTFCLGGLAFTAFMVLMATGLLLLFYYRPSPEHAFDSIVFLESSVFGGWFIRSLHRMSSHVLLFLIFMHTLRVLLTGAFRRPRQMNWLIGFLLLVLTLLEAYTGYLLPLDQLGYWATQTGMKLLQSAPLGDLAYEFMVPDKIGGPLSLLRFYILHAALIPVTMFFLCLFHFYKIRKNKGVLPYL